MNSKFIVHAYIYIYTYWIYIERYVLILLCNSLIAKNVIVLTVTYTCGSNIISDIGKVSEHPVKDLRIRIILHIDK